jgi:hypothetical protein
LPVGRRSVRIQLSRTISWTLASTGAGPERRGLPVSERNEQRDGSAEPEVSPAPVPLPRRVRGAARGPATCVRGTDGPPEPVDDMTLDRLLHGLREV